MRLPVFLVMESGCFVAKIPVLPGCISQGKTREEALVNIAGVAEICMAKLKKTGKALPEEYTLADIDIAS